jgi:hypothetical protein
MSLSVAEQHRLAQIERELSGDTVLTTLCAELDSTSAKQADGPPRALLPIRVQSAMRSAAAGGSKRRRAAALAVGALCLLLVGPILLLVGALGDMSGLVSVGSALLPLVIGGVVLLGVAAVERRRRDRPFPRSATRR